MSDTQPSLLDAAEAPIDLVGGKAQTLGRLKRAGFKVPPGIVVTTDTRDDPALESRLTELGAGSFAVRSSGVREDGADQSLAGRYRSILNVDPGSATHAVSEVRQFARRKDGERIAVLVQTMVDPVCAGVAFTADPVTGDRSTTIVAATSGVADDLLSGRLAGDEWRVNGRKARPVRRPEGVSSRRLVRQVAHIADRIAVELGKPQDIEWAWDGKELWIVQARPITELPDDVSWDPPAPGMYHRSFRFGEWIPEPVTPLFESWLLTRMERRLHRFIGDEIGQVAPEPLHVVVNGWYYYSMNWVPAPGVAFTRNLRHILPKLRKDWRKIAGLFPQTVRFSFRHLEERWRRDMLPRYRTAVTDAEHRVDDASTGELVEMIDELSDLAGLYFAWMAVVAGSAYKLENQLARFWNRHLKDKVGASHMTLLQGLKSTDERRLTPQLETLDWVTAAAATTSVTSNLEALKARRIETQEKAEQILERSPRRLAKFHRLVTDAQHLEPVREEQVAQLSLAWPVMRRAVQRLGESLQASGAIAAVNDVFFLTRSEVERLLSDPAPVSDRVMSRRANREKASRLAAPLTVGRVPMAIRMMFAMTGRDLGANPSEQAIVRGVPASPGRATGRVRIVRDSSQFETLQEGEVLVAPLTAPAWADLFLRAAAVVTDVGNALAHASIVAREYGIPAVVGCGDATSRLHDGQMVMVDGSTGNVEPAGSPQEHPAV